MRVCVRVCVCVCENAHKYFQLQIVFFRLDKQNLWQFQQLIADSGGPQRPFPPSTLDRDRDQDRRPKTSGCPARTPSILLRLQTLLRLAGDAVVNKATKRTEREKGQRKIKKQRQRRRCTSSLKKQTNNGQDNAKTTVKEMT